MSRREFIGWFVGFLVGVGVAEILVFAAHLDATGAVLVGLPAGLIFSALGYVAAS